jgi:hypothetical protein
VVRVVLLLVVFAAAFLGAVWLLWLGLACGLEELC